MADQASSAPWRCFSCSEEVDGGFSVCWNCGTAFDGTVNPDFERADSDGTSQGGIVKSGLPVALMISIVIALSAVARDVPVLIELLLLIAIAVIAGGIVCWLSVVSDDQADTVEPHAVPSQAHCLQCIRPISHLQHYCGHCCTCVGKFTPYLPFERIPYYCQFFGQLFKIASSRDRVPGWKRALYFSFILVLEPRTFLGWLLEILWLSPGRTLMRWRRGS